MRIERRSWALGAALVAAGMTAVAVATSGLGGPSLVEGTAVAASDPAPVPAPAPAADAPAADPAAPPAPAEPGAGGEAPFSDRWKYAIEIERQARVEARRAAVALELAEQRLREIIEAEKRREAARRQELEQRATREETLKKLSDLYVTMKVDKAGQVLEQLDPATASDVLAMMPPKRAAKIVAAMKPERAAQLLGRWTAAGGTR